MLLIGKVFGHGLIEAGSWHEDPKGAQDDEEGEDNQAESVDDSRRELPLVARGHFVILAAVALGDEAQFVQDPGQLRLGAEPWGAASGREELLGLTWARRTGVRCGVKHVAVVGVRGTSSELHAARAAPLAGALHAQQSGAPVQQKHANLWEAKEIIFYVNLEQFEN